MFCHPFRVFTLPRSVVLICLVRTLWQLLATVLLTLFQQLCFSRHACLIVGIHEQLWRDEEQILCIIRSAEIHAIDVVGIGIHLALKGGRNAHLILQNCLAHLALEHRMTSLVHRVLQHQQTETYGKFRWLATIEQHRHHLLKLRCVVNVETECLRGQFRALNHALRIVSRVVHLHQTHLRLSIAVASQSEVCQLCRSATQLTVFLFRGYRTRNLLAALNLNQITTHSVVISIWFLPNSLPLMGGLGRVFLLVSQLILSDCVCCLQGFSADSLVDVDTLVAVHLESQLDSIIFRLTCPTMRQLLDEC